uniref:Uncharacterized protein n=1 Tax=Stomoxys calcitrans TaxID=35570 RepID=A0A1I8Q8T8_STOCA
MYFCKLIFTTALLLLTVAESLDTTASSTSQCCCKVCKCDTREEKNLPDPYLERLLRERRKSIDEQLTSLRTSNTQPQADQWNSESNMNSQQLEENIAESAQLEAEHYDEPQYGEASAKELEINANSVDIIKTPKEEQPKMERKINQPLRPSPEAKGYQQNSLVNENSDYDEFRGRIFRRRKHRNRNRNRNKNSKNSKKSPIITKRKRMLPNEVANKRSSEDNFDNHIHSRESDHNWSSVSRQLVSDELGSARRRRAAFENQMEKKTVGNGEQDEYRRKIALHFRNEILQCKAFSSLEDFLNSLPKNETSNANREEETEEINEEFSTRNIHEFMTENPEFHITTKRSNNTLSKSHEELDVPPTKWPSTNDSHNDDDYEDEEEYYEDIDFGNTTATDASKIDPETITKDLPVVSKDSFLSDRDTNYKLNISINAKVNGNTTNKMFYGNGSICVNPAYEVDRSAQHSDLASLEHGEEYRSFVDNMKTMQSNPKEKANPLDVTPDKLSSNIVEKVFQSVRDHPQLKVLWPSLKNNQLPERTHMPRFNALRNQDNEQHIQHSEQLMREALNILNNAIDQKFQTKSCVPLSSDLREFYNLILRTNEEQRREREKRQVEWGKLRKEDDENSKIYNNGKVVNKNDGQWEENSLMDLQNEDGVDVKLRRELWNRKYLGTNLNDLELLEQLYSSEFSKLLKACELYREISKVFGRKDNLNL